LRGLDRPGEAEVEPRIAEQELVAGRSAEVGHLFWPAALKMNWLAPAPPVIVVLSPA